MRLIFCCGNESVGRRNWRNNVARRWHRLRVGHAAAYCVPACLSLDLNWIPLYIQIQLTVCILKYDLRRAFRNINYWRESCSVCASYRCYENEWIWCGVLFENICKSL